MEEVDSYTSDIAPKTITLIVDMKYPFGKKRYIKWLDAKNPETPNKNSRRKTIRIHYRDPLKSIRTNLKKQEKDRLDRGTSGGQDKMN